MYTLIKYIKLIYNINKKRTLFLAATKFPKETTTQTTQLTSVFIGKHKSLMIIYIYTI